jgi:hypothetical protein
MLVCQLHGSYTSDLDERALTSARCRGAPRSSRLVCQLHGSYTSDLDERALQGRTEEFALLSQEIDAAEQMQTRSVAEGQARVKVPKKSPTYNERALLKNPTNAPY